MTLLTLLRLMLLVCIGGEQECGCALSRAWIAAPACLVLPLLQLHLATEMPLFDPESAGEGQANDPAAHLNSPWGFWPDLPDRVWSRNPSITNSSTTHTTDRYTTAK